MKQLLTTIISALALSGIMSATQSLQTLISPDGTITLKVNSERLVYEVSVNGKTVIAPSEISMTLSDGAVYGQGSKCLKAVRTSDNATIDASAYKKSEITDRFNALTLKYKAFNVEFRAYDDGVAYRFISNSRQPFTVKSEQADFVFPEDFKAWIPYVQQNDDCLETQFHNSFENTYTYAPVSEFDRTHYAFLPILVDACDGVKVCITEADLLHYPGMHIYNTDGGTKLSGVNAPYPKNRVKNPDPEWLIPMWVEGTEEFIAKCSPGCSFPWRVIGISKCDKDLLDSDLVFKLATPKDPSADFSWVKPGKVAWDWWNTWNIYGVDFKSGINTETYKYYIDFASKYGIEYVILDEGWSPQSKADLYQVVPEIDLDELISFGKSRNVKLVLWAGFYPFQRDIEGICKYYSAKGIAGFKVDFMDSDDQQIPEFLERAAIAAAENHLMLDFHGIYKPTGLSRRYPNVVNYEGIHGLEQMKWGADPKQVVYDVTAPFIRFFAGPADYTQGAMRNATYGNIRSVSSEAMSPGTRCRQLAEYVVFFSPLNMLCDSPSNYMNEPECTGFIANVPTTWDETVAIDGKVGEYAAIARRSGKIWYLGAMTDWTERDLTLDLSFLGDGNFEMELFKDGVNADMAARDYKKETVAVPANRSITVHLAPGGGFAAKFYAK